MKKNQSLFLTIALVVTLVSFAGTSSSTASGWWWGGWNKKHKHLPSHGEVREALISIVNGDEGENAGFGLNMWATLVNRQGEVCVVAFSGDDSGDQWPGSRVISAQKANTANAFSLPGLAVSTSNLYSAVQPGGSLYGLQFSNPVDPSVAYRGPASRFGQRTDPMVSRRVGGVNVFGGGLACYNADGELVGALGVSGDTSCTDHIIAWKLRHLLNLDNVPAGVSVTGDDNAIYDIIVDGDGLLASPSGWGHPDCGGGQADIAAALPTTHPVGPDE